MRCETIETQLDFANLLPVDSIPNDVQFIKEDNINDNAKDTEIVENNKEFDDDVENFYRTFVESPHDEQFEEDKLQHIRNGDNTIDDWKLISKRQPTASNFEEFKNTIRMFYVNEQAISYDCIKINELNSPKTSSNAINSNSKCSKITSNNFGGLTNIAYLAVGAEIV